jgi:hypothetical protein
VAIHLTTSVDCRSRQASFAMTNRVCSLEGAQRRINPSSGIAAPSFLGLAMTMSSDSPTSVSISVHQWFPSCFRQ